MNQFLRTIPRYRCHKQVGALKIKAVIPNPRGMELHFEDERFAPHEVPQWWFLKHGVTVGGYLVSYDDGHLSWSPAEGFEAGYTLLADPEAAADTQDAS